MGVTLRTGPDGSVWFTTCEEVAQWHEKGKRS